jgi:hypothetical protein
VLGDDDDPDWLTLRQAARRVHRHVKTIKRWRRNGMTVRKVAGVNYVHIDSLTSWWRARMLNDPTRRRST